jgi:Fe-S cluster assembly protein SufD
VFVATKSNADFVVHPRNLVIVGRRAQAKIIESYVSVSDNVYFTNAVTEIVVGEGSVLEHQRVQFESAQAFHVGAIHAHLERSSNFVSNSVSFGGGLVRNGISAVLGGEGAEATLNGLYAGIGTQLVDNHTIIDHATPHCSSHELYKGILDNRSRGVFNGKIVVRKDAQKTDAKQTNKNLILSDDAMVDTKPQLEIFANDVRCTHGATIGQLDDDAIFYLRARGIGAEKARDMLIDAFASDVIDRIGVETVRGRIGTLLRRRLEKGRTRAVAA